MDSNFLDYESNIKNIQYQKKGRAVTDSALPSIEIEINLFIYKNLWFNLFYLLSIYLSRSMSELTCRNHCCQYFQE